MKSEGNNSKHKSPLVKDYVIPKRIIEDSPELRTQINNCKILWLSIIRWMKYNGDPEDILQECCISYIRNIETIRDLAPASRRAYIFNIARNKIKDIRKKKARQRENREKYIAKKATEERLRLNNVYNTESQNDFISKRFKIKSELTLFEYIESFLPEDQYTAIRLWANGNTYKQVAKKMNKETSQAKGLIERAKKKIKQRTH